MDEPTDERQEDVGLPMKGMNQLIKDSCADLRCATDTRDLLHQCCLEFIRHLSGEARRHSEGDQRKTLCHEHVLKALESLGYSSDYCDAANSALGECQEQAERRARRKHSRLDKCGVPEAELYRQQQELIERARAEQAQVESTQLSEWRLLLDGQQHRPPPLVSGAPPPPTTTTPLSADLDEDYDAD